MTEEEDPYDGPGELEPTKVQLKGPNVTSTFDSPPRADAVKAHEAAIRKHLRDRRRGGDPPSSQL
jgi:hypothetical protein